ncbi:uncharacterized protein LOC129587581 [Paramacrobiotus metropolitanus]|uniref:uncharacterized protein LOC129587581 n=1 Tax=Paramacrobiotus metropolitanus TaxID=2943436 RepID=UPI0024457802|nr:uncharacterized protein LOC129587581 [Paramacrobiotus metropolitanus]
MLSPTARSLRKNGIGHFFTGGLSIIWQIGVHICAGLHTAEFNIYMADYARDIANSSTGIFAGIVFILAGVAAFRITNILKENENADVTVPVKIFKALSGISIPFSFILVFFSGYLAYRTSHQFEEANLQQITIAHAALPFHVLHCLTGIADMGLAIWGLLMQPVTKPLPPVSFRSARDRMGLENPSYSNNNVQLP